MIKILSPLIFISFPGVCQRGILRIDDLVTIVELERQGIGNSIEFHRCSSFVATFYDIQCR